MCHRAKINIVAFSSNFLGAHQREVRRVRNEARKAEDEARKADLENRRKEAEAEELKRVPYEEEMNLCAYLINYLDKETKIMTQNENHRYFGNF